ncbi:MAG: hypothetical protein GY765_39960, partial [bacterium]|nr:hypothetical protein [bacterium]
MKKTKRTHLIVGKAVFLSIFFFLLFAVVYLTGLSAGYFLYGIGDIGELNYVIHSLSSLFTNYFASLFLMLFPIAAMVCVSLFFSVLFNNSVIAIISTLGFNFFSYILVEMEVLKEFFLFNYLSFPIEVFQKTARGLPILWTPEIWYMIIATLVYTIFFLSL